MSGGRIFHSRSATEIFEDLSIEARQKETLMNVSYLGIRILPVQKIKLSSANMQILSLRLCGSHTRMAFAVWACRCRTVQFTLEVLTGFTFTSGMQQFCCFPPLVMCCGPQEFVEVPSCRLNCQELQCFEPFARSSRSANSYTSSGNSIVEKRNKTLEHSIQLA